MSLFSKEKQIITKKQESPILPEFPDIPDDNEIPSYESTLEAIKKEVGTDIPMRETSIERKLPSATPDFSQSVMPSQNIGDDKPVFVKLDNYKEALAQLTELKKKVDEAETLINQLEQLKNEENIKLENWKHNLQSMKDRLLSLDKGLFEA
jgi:hypothetical protein